MNKIKTISRNGLFKSFFLVGSITIIVKLVGFYKETVVSATYGLSEMLDTYYIAFLIPSFLSHVFLGAFKNVFVPNYITETRTGNNIASFQATSFMVTMVSSFVFYIIAVLCTDVYVETIFGGHTQEFYELVKIQFKYLAPCILIWGFSSLMSGILNINKEFKFSSFDSIFTPITVIVFLVFFHDLFKEKTLAIATLIGSLFNLFFLLTVCLNKKLIKIGYPNFKNPNAINMFKQVPAKVSSGFLTGLIEVTDQFFAAQLIVGSISALNYGLKIPAFINGILIIAIGNVLLPHFSKTFLDNKKKAFSELNKILKIIFISSFIVTFFGVLFSDFIVKILFERKAFTSDDTALVADIQRIFLIYIPFKICGMVMVNFLTSINKNSFMAYVAAVSVVTNIILDYVLMQYFGLLGIAICTTIIVIARSFVFYIYCRKQRSKLDP